VNADKEKGEKRAAVKAKFGLDDLAVNALDGAALDGLFAQCQTSTGLNGAFRRSTTTILSAKCRSKKWLKTGNT
jgi:hypothetical protein